MKDFKLNTKTVCLYASIKELPIELSKKFHSYLLQDMGIGSTMDAVDDHLAKLFNYLKNKKENEAIEEAKNLRYNLFAMLSGINFKSLSLACLVHSYDNVRQTDHSDEGLTKLIETLSDDGLTDEIVSDHLDEIKKKLMSNGLYISQNILEPTPDTSNN